MRKALTTALVSLSLLWINLFLPCQSKAYEYRLTQPPVSAPLGGTIKLTNADQFVFNANGTLSGALTYFACGRYCRSGIYYCLDATWDNIGDLLSYNQLPGNVACGTQTPISTVGSKVTYAVNGNESAGYNGAYGGIAWLDRPSSHYTWTTDIYEYICGVYYCLDYVTQSNGSSQVVPWAPPTTFLIQLVSDGDFPLNITGTIAQVQVQGYGTVGTGKVTSVTGTQVMNPDGTVEAPIGCLPGPVAPGTTCGLAVTFDPSGVTAAASTGYGYNAMYLELVSDAGALPGWNGHFTITGIPAPSTPD